MKYKPSEMYFYDTIAGKFNDASEYCIEVFVKGCWGLHRDASGVSRFKTVEERDGVLQELRRQVRYVETNN